MYFFLLGTQNVWDKTINGVEDISSATAEKGGEAADSMKSGAVYLKDGTVNQTGKAIDATKSGAAKAWDSTWNQTKETTGNVADAINNKGSEFCGAVKSGTKAGWNKAKGGD